VVQRTLNSGRRRPSSRCCCLRGGGGGWRGRCGDCRIATISGPPLRGHSMISLTTISRPASGGGRASRQTASQSVADDRWNNTSSRAAAIPMYANIAVSSSSYGRVRRTTIPHGKFYLPMTSQKFELGAKKKQRGPTRRNSIKAECRHAMDHRHCYHYCYRYYYYSLPDGRSASPTSTSSILWIVIIIIRRRRRRRTNGREERRKEDVERHQQQCNGSSIHQLRSTESVDV